jgi:hypothetical protein
MAGSIERLGENVKAKAIEAEPRRLAEREGKGKRAATLPEKKV